VNSSSLPAAFLICDALIALKSELLYQVLTQGDKLEERRGADSGTDSNPVEVI
jgi:hypothetical protein